MTEQGFVALAHGSSDLVLAAHFNFYGTRLVTGSADHRIRVFDLDERAGWQIVDAWRGHNGEVLDVKWNGCLTGQVLGSIGEDLKFKVWKEDRAEDLLSGRMFRNIFTQSCARSVVYASLDFLNIRYETYVAIATRDGMVSLLEPVDPEKFDDWMEIDQFWVCGGPVPRGVETSFKVAFQQAERSNYMAMARGNGVETLSLAVAAMEVVKVYRLVRSGEGARSRYHFLPPSAILTGSGSLIRDIAWSPESFVRHDCIATAAADGFVRFYDMFTHPAGGSNDTQSGSQRKPLASNSGAISTRAQSHAPSGIGAGLAGSFRADPSSASLPVSHEWKLIDTIKHEGVWRVAWIRAGNNILASTGDGGKAHLWKQGRDGRWSEFADFGPDTNDLGITL